MHFCRANTAKVIRETAPIIVFFKTKQMLTPLILLVIICLVKETFCLVVLPTCKKILIFLEILIITFLLMRTLVLQQKMTRKQARTFSQKKTGKEELFFSMKKKLSNKYLHKIEFSCSSFVCRRSKFVGRAVS
jgi:c-di-AMP phosphodiesterase-like protein